jgi:hypothetical protein
MFGDGDKETLKSEIWNDTYNTMFNRSIFFLHKGALVRDSRGHIGLAHVISIDQTDYVIPQGQPLRLTFRLANTGQAHWLNTNSQIFGLVRLASHLTDSSGISSTSFSRTPACRSDLVSVLTIDVTVTGPWRVPRRLISSLRVT